MKLHPNIGKKKISSRELVIALLVLLMSIQGIFFSDLYLPALPEIAAALHTTRSWTEISIAIYFLGFAVAQCIYGPISEQYGRRNIVLSGMLIAFFGNIIILFSHNITIFLIGRFIQAAGMGAPIALSRVILRDTFSDNIDFARMVSYVGAGMLIAPIFAPIIGGYLQVIWNWHADFIFIQIFVLVNLIIFYFYLPETLTDNKRSKITLKIAAQHYWLMLQNTSFLVYVICAGCSLAGMIAYVTVSAFLFEKDFHFSVIQYSWLSVSTSAILTLSMLINARLVTKFGINKQIRNGLYFMLFSCILISLFILIHSINPVTTIISILVFYFGAGFIFTNASAGSFTSFKERIGFVGSLYNVLRFIIISLIGTIVAASIFKPIYTVLIMFFILSFIGFFLYYTKLIKLKDQI